MNLVINRVNQLCSDVDNSISYLNWGGCAVFAAFMGQCLEAYGDVKIAIGSMNDVDSLDDVRENLEANVLQCWNDAGVDFTHVIVEFSYNGVKYHIDSSGAHPPDIQTHVGQWSIPKGRLSVSEITALAADGGWNKRFDRVQIPKMKKMFDDAFAHLFQQGLKPTIG
jgi:hypothetical protein